MSVTLPGFHAVKHALRFGASVSRLVTVDRHRLGELVAELAPDLTAEFARAEVVDRAELAKLTEPPPVTGVAAVVARPDQAIPAAGPIVLLEAPTHHGNVGAVIRVAAAAGAAAVLTTGALDPWHPAALRGSAGLHFAIPVARVDDLPPGRVLVAWDPAGTPLPEAGLPADAVHAFGSERRGLSRELLARSAVQVAIPMRPGVSSLNLATSVAVALYSLPARPPPG